MAKIQREIPVSGNHLLARLPPADQRRLAPHLEPVPLAFSQILYPPGGPVDFVYFPEHGVVSVVAVMADKRTIEVGLCGREGAVGAAAVLGDPTSPFRVQVQVAGDGMRIGIDAFRHASKAGGAMHRLLARYHAAFLTQTAQSVACNGLHSVRQRCCRWLLMTHDRMGADVFDLTHEFLGMMLGVRRASVSEVLNPLQADGLIGYERGRFTVHDRSRLEDQSCECHAFVQSQFDRLLP
ncbi:Crp/Fnr family transcriptional regulator [Zavarzinella formosa]|uniref:Crp/Fnr family transcriptional regulator n=1 Tax=Zavarzinella formosa TaxID=360055 RepID=UPI0002E480DC|nr:Crp/Fnr family transcriptional regulator [Zavarzinella formosa]